MRRDGTCRWGAIDLDAHGIGDADRLADALAVADALAAVGLTPYLVRSRGGKGYHVWILLDEPGAPAADLHALLDTLAAEIRDAGHVDVFPTARRGAGEAIFLPAFGDERVFDRDLDLVDLEHVEPDDPALVPAAPRIVAPPSTGWPPPYWREASGSQPRIPRALDAVRDLLVVHPNGLLCARNGARNTIAGMVARRILRGGGGFEAFEAWDRGNVPPLASEEPNALRRWWKWAERKSARRSNGGRA